MDHKAYVAWDNDGEKQVPFVICKNKFTAVRLGEGRPVSAIMLERHYGEWWGPVKVIQPMQEDLEAEIAAQVELNELMRQKSVKGTVLERMKQMGFTQEEIDSVRKGLI